MKIICGKSDIVNGVNIVQKAVPVRTTHSILENILVDTTSGCIKLTGNDMELGIETVIEGDIAEGGSIALEAKLFSDIIRKLPDSEVTITTDDRNQAVITCDKARFIIPGHSAIDYVNLPDVDRADPVIISKFTLKELIRQTIFSAATTDSNPIMAGELFTFEGEILTATTLDGQRISIRKTALKEEVPYKKVIVPGKTLTEISKIIGAEADEDVQIYITDSHIVFEFDNTVVVSRLVEGEYFHVDRMISADYATKLTVNRAELISSIERAALLMKESFRKPTLIDVTDTAMEITVDTPIGSMKEQIDIAKEGKDIKIGFNPRFLLDALRVVDEEEVKLYLVNSRSPFIIRDDDASYMYVILPISFNE